MNQIVIASFPLLGVFIGAFSSVFGSYLVSKSKLSELEQKYSQNQELEIRQYYLKRLEQYSEILKADGEHTVEVFQPMKGIGFFDFEAYQNNIRPLVFECLHILDEDVIKSAREIDKSISETSSITNREIEIHLIELAEKYFQLIKNIERHVLTNSFAISKTKL